MQKRILAKIILAAAIAMIGVDAVAIAPGLYIGLMMGPAQNGAGRTRAQVKPVTNPPQPVPPANSSSSIAPNTAAASPKSTQFGTRIYIGYKFNQYGSFEGGFTYFSGISYNIVQDPSLATPGSSFPLQAAAGTTARLRDIDFVGKLDYSYSDTIGIYAKAGVAAVYTTTPGALQPTASRWVPAPTRSNPYGTKLISTGSNKYSSKLTPTFSVGVTYDINPNWQTDISWTRIMVGSAVKNMNYFAIGLSYHFVDLYCGQFLCAE
ncbi:MAG TPA: outer membrane beta-barrel protein [Gammaproteobacteria bacterium]|jgi:opacity protein-like surface antigen|nr:outer membrane beta-barrel protein [Gammaproteobacteria bacterium]